MPAETLVIAAPIAVARDLVQDGLASYPTSTRDAATLAATAITVIGATSDIITLASSREVIVDVLRRLRAWGQNDQRSELTLRLDRGTELRLSTQGSQSDVELLMLADSIIHALYSATD